MKFDKLLSAAIGVAVLAALGGTANAGDIRKPKHEARWVHLVKYRVDDGVHYTKSPVRRVMTVSASQYRSSNSYICTPSGFGQKARCYSPNIFAQSNM